MKITIKFPPIEIEGDENLTEEEIINLAIEEIKNQSIFAIITKE